LSMRNFYIDKQKMKKLGKVYILSYFKWIIHFKSYLSIGFN
jgi:hypothetical protein